MRPLQSLPLRQAIVFRLRSDAGVLGLVPAERIYGQRSPATLTWPFVRYGSPDETPVRKGTQLRVTLHVFSKEQFEDEVSNIAAAVQASLEDAAIDLDGGSAARLAFVGSQIIPDAAEADAWHGIVTFTATIG